jgi:FKBP-type peptidyl-prolyl cis-trans isomerase FklB
MKRIFAIVLGILLIAAGGHAADKKMELTGEGDRINYSVGYQLGGDFQKQGLSLNPEALLQGIRDAISRAEPLLSQAQMSATLTDLKKKVVADQRRSSHEADARFLSENAKKPGMTTLASGVQYRVLKEGAGKQPKPGDSVTLRHRFGRADQWEAMSSLPQTEPKTYPLRKALPGLQEALSLMKEGAVWQVVLPPGPALGTQGEALESAGVLVYELELISVQP